MKTDRNIFITFLVNLFFSIFEFVGGIITHSNAIVSDAIHDMGDALSIGIAFILEKKSKQKPDHKYTYGYTRYSVIGSFITTIVLLISSVLVIWHSIERIMNPVDINYNGMILFAIVGIIANSFAAFITREGDSLNQKTVRLHMLEDVLGWIVVLIGAIVMRFTDFVIIDPILSIGVAGFILYKAFGHFKIILDLFLEKIPDAISIDEIKEHLSHIDGVKDVHHIHVWSIDGVNNYATMHVIVDEVDNKIKGEIREELEEHGINHVTIELELPGEHCHDEECNLKEVKSHGHHHHHH